MSVASASSDPNQPSFSAEPSASLINPTLGTNWQLDSVSGLYKLTNPDPGAKNSLTVGMYGSGLGKFGPNVTQGTFATNGAGIEIGTLYADLYAGSGSGNKILTFDFSKVKDNNYALKGNLQIKGNKSNTNEQTDTSKFIGTFGGKGISGNILINTAAKQANFTFNGNANLEGHLIIEQGSGDGKTKDKGHSFIFDQGGIKGSVLAVTGNSSSNEFSFDSTRSNGDAHISGGILVANGTGGPNLYHTFVFGSKNQSQVVISGELQDKKPAGIASNSSWEATHGLKGGKYAIVVRADADSGAKNSNTQANFLFETNAKVGKVLAVNYQTTNTSSKANYVIKSGKKVTFDSIESKQKGDTTITLESNASATVLNGILTDSSGTNTISLGGDATFNIQGGTDNKITTLNFNGTAGGNIFNINGGTTTSITTLTLNGSTGNVLNAKSGTTTIGTLTLSNSTTNNTINANGGSTTITNAVSLNNNTTLNLGIGNGNLTLTNHLTAGNSNTGTANINFTGNGTLTSNLSVGSSGTLTSNLSTTATNGTININVASGD
ncbi:hypothetical protein, partial [uncultured Helicobacter sp.]|uniref:hypothetical protein n=1 Tax=uncultured Helicobacter sp. TaxID=175537 RepID=UPI0026025D96